MLFYHHNIELLMLIESKHNKTAYRFTTPEFRRLQRDRQDKYASPLQRGDHELSFAPLMIEIAAVEAEIWVRDVAMHNMHR